jgi:hypothetical protein
MFQSMITQETIHEVVGMQTVNNYTLQKHFHILPGKMYKHLGLLSICTSSIIQYPKQHNFSKSGCLSSGERVGATHSVGSTGKS